MAVPQMTVSMQAPHSALAPPAPNPEVAATAKRRQFSSRDSVASWPPRTAVPKSARSGHCCAARASTPRNWPRGGSRARRPNVRGLNRRSAGAKPTPPSPKPGCAGSGRPPRPASMSKKTLYLTRAAHGRGAGGAILMSALHVLAPEIGLAPRVRGLAYQPGRNLSSRRSSPPAEFAEAPHASVPRTPRIQRVRAAGPARGAVERPLCRLRPAHRLRAAAR